MNIEFSKKADEDLIFWHKSGNKAVIKKIDDLLEDISKNPKNGLGKPKPLKHEPGLWSRRINQEHRIVYEIFEEKNEVVIHYIKGHYEYLKKK